MPMDIYGAALPPPANVTPVEPPAPLIPALRLARLFKRYAWLILGCTVLGGLVVFAYAHTLPKTYTANSVLSVEGTNFAIPQLQGAVQHDNGPDPMPYVHTEMEILHSHALLAQVVDQLHLDAVPEFNPALQPTTLLTRVKAFVGALFSQLVSAPHSPGSAKATADDLVIGTVYRALSLFQDQQSLVISVSFTSRDPVLAAKVVNTLIADYIAQQANRRTKFDTGASTALAERVAKARADLREIDQQMQSLRSNQDLIALRAGSVGQQQVEELTSALSRVSVDKTEAQLKYDRAVAATKAGTADALASVINSPTVAALREQEATAASHYADLSAHYGRNYPGMHSAGASLGSVRGEIAREGRRIVNSLGAQLQVLNAQETDIKTQLDRARGKAVSAENANAQLDQLKQEETSRRALYQSLLEGQQRTVAQPKDDATPDVHVISTASVPGLPSGPRMMLAGAIGGGGGWFLGCLLALTRLRRVDGFFSADEVTAATDLPVLATLPRDLIRRGRGILTSSGPRAPVQAATPEELESLRALRSRLRLLGRMRLPRCVAFLPQASGRHDGHAARLAAAFARVSAGDGERVLLVEGDLEDPKLGQALGVPVRRRPQAAPGGILGVVAGSEWRDMLEPDRQPTLDLLVAPGRVDNAFELLNCARFQNFLVEAADSYELVVLHAAPALDPAATALARRADATLLVLDGRLDVNAARQAVDRISEVSASPMAAVLVDRA
jgi:polysaccharide biosynthesis transport protein